MSTSHFMTVWKVQSWTPEAASFPIKDGWKRTSGQRNPTLVSDDNNVAIWELVGLLKSRGFRSGLHLLAAVEIKGDIGELLLDVSDNLTLSSGGEGVPTFSEDLHEVIGEEITTSKIKTDNGVGKGVSLVDGDSVGNTITRVQHTSSDPVVLPEA
jgi:hypothetical protein